MCWKTQRPCLTCFTSPPTTILFGIENARLRACIQYVQKVSAIKLQTPAMVEVHPFLKFRTSKLYLWWHLPINT